METLIFFQDYGYWCTVYLERPDAPYINTEEYGLLKILTRLKFDGKLHITVENPYRKVQHESRKT